MDQNKRNWPKFSEYLEPLSLVIKDIFEDDASSTGMLSSMGSQISNFDIMKKNAQNVVFESIDEIVPSKNRK